MPDAIKQKLGVHEAPKIEGAKDEIREKKDRKTEGIRERPHEEIQKAEELAKPTTPVISKVPPAPLPKTELLEDIEEVLAQGLEPYYKSLTPAQRQQFKQEGEKTARKIEMLMQKARVKVSEIIGLIRRWLALIPGINKFFVEKESKIKADKIVRLKEEE